MRALSPDVSFDVLDIRNCFEDAQNNVSCIVNEPDKRKKRRNNRDDNSEEAKLGDTGQGEYEPSRMLDFREDLSAKDEESLEEDDLSATSLQ